MMRGNVYGTGIYKQANAFLNGQKREEEREREKRKKCTEIDSQNE